MIIKMVRISKKAYKKCEKSLAKKKKILKKKGKIILDKPRQIEKKYEDIAKTLESSVGNLLLIAYNPLEALPKIILIIVLSLTLTIHQLIPLGTIGIEY